MMLDRDWIGRVGALAVGVAIGLRALQVANVYFEKSSYYAISGGGTVIGLVVAVGFVGGLALWRARRQPDGHGGLRLAALAAGMILGGVVGAIVFRAT